MRVTRAIIPAAGLGTRMRPLTLACPKELLPLGAKPVLHHVLDEAAEAGLERVCVVISPAKQAVRDYFAAVAPPVEVEYAVQEEQLGLGHAILCAREFAGDQPVAILLGDTVLETPQRQGPLSRMVSRAAQTDRPVVLVQRLPRERLSRYGVVRPAEPPADAFAIDDLVEKPTPEAAPSEYAVSARYLLPAGLMAYLARTPAAANGEIQLSDALALYLREGHPYDALVLRDGERRHDIGSLEAYFEAFSIYAQRALQERRLNL
ncbi:MAG TPA: sugar phosphate nucleotidyltransferase [Armatimonadota bacterium]|jgi:UTP--glucose-1-phosphate uridylyltransferase